MKLSTFSAFAAVVTVAVPTAVLVPPAVATSPSQEHGHVAESYTIEVLKTPDTSAGSSALGINDSGDVVGVNRPGTTARPQFTVLWERHGDHFHAHQLANLAGSDFSRGFAINKDQMIVGEAFNDAGNSVGVRWLGDQAPTHITSLSETGLGVLNDVNDTGTAVGTAASHAVRLTADDTVELLTSPVLPVAGSVLLNSGAKAISKAGDIAGSARVNVPHNDHFHAQSYAAIWRIGTDGKLLAVPPAAKSPSVTKFTDEGEVLGSATINGLQAAIHWDAQDEPSVLPAPTIADYTHTAATAGADDVVVGYASKFAANTSFGGAAIAWDDHGVVNLNERVVNLPADVTLQSAADINASGQIVGTADTADGSRGFVLTPVEEVEPEPVSTSISAPAVKQVYGLPTKLLVTLTSGATGKVTVTAGTKKVTGTLSNGQARVVLPAKSLAPGNRTVTISYPGVAGEFSPATASAKVQVSKAKTTVKAKSAKTKVKRGKVAVFKIAVSSPSVKPTGKIRVNFAGKTKTLQLKNSKATIKIKVAKATKPGAKTAKVTYLGDAFAGASNAKTVRVTITD